MLRNYLKSTQSLLSGYSSDERLDEKKELLIVLVMLLVLLITLAVVIAYPDESLYNYSVTEIVFFLFFISGVGCLLLAVWVVYYDYKNYEKVKDIIETNVALISGLTRDDLNKLSSDNNEIKRYQFHVGTLLGEYYAPLIHKIMNIGVVPIILGIIALILSDLTSTEAYVGSINITTALLLIGGTMEALAFILGFMFPEGSVNKQLTDELKNKQQQPGVDEEIIKRVLLAVMPELQKGINETFKQMTIETKVSFNDSIKMNSNSSTNN